MAAGKLHHSSLSTFGCQLSTHIVSTTPLDVVKMMGNIAGSIVTTGSNSTFLGGNVGGNYTVESHNTLVGDSANGAVGTTNATAIGANAFVGTSNSLVLGSINGTNGATADTNVGIGTTTPNSDLQVKGSVSVGLRSTASALSIIDASDCVFVFTGSIGGSGANLPTASGISGRIYYVKNRGTVAFSLFTILNQTIDGTNFTSSAMNLPVNTVAHLVSDGSNWIKIN